MSAKPLRSAIGGALSRIVRTILTGAVPEFWEHRETAIRNADELRKLTELVLHYQNMQLRSERPNPLNRFGRKCFSQADQDGITLEILKRMGAIDGGSYAEFGVGDGTENNTLILAAMGWKGFWVGAQDLAFRHSTTDKFFHQKAWITADNVLELLAKGLAHLNVASPDVVSVDLDGNDIYFVEKLLSAKLRPKLYIVEYNAKYPPPIEFRMAYDPAHTWKQDDYFGASLSAFVRLFSAHGYKLICCNSDTGSDAFFIDSIHEHHFKDVPTDIDRLFVEPRYFLYKSYGHKPSLKSIEKIFGF
jgi:hypothetical protein